MPTSPPTRRAVTGALLAGSGMALAGCDSGPPADADARDMGDFRLGLTILVSENLKRIPPSRPASADEIEAAMREAIQTRFGGFAGDTTYHIAVSLDGYALAPPGIPVVLTPKSVLVVTANVWTADPQEKVLGPEQILTFEGAETLILGSGLIKTAEEQLETLARNTAWKIQSWMLRNGDTFRA